jgi:hypothetical protein
MCNGAAGCSLLRSWSSEDAYVAWPQPGGQGTYAGQLPAEDAALDPDSDDQFDGTSCLDALRAGLGTSVMEVDLDEDSSFGQA